MDREEVEVNVHVTFRHTESTPALKTYAIDKVAHAVKKYVSHSAHAQVILSVEKRDQCAEVVLHSKGFDISCKAVTEDLYSAIDKVIDTLDAQLRKQKEKQRDHKHHAELQR